MTGLTKAWHRFSFIYISVPFLAPLLTMFVAGHIAYDLFNYFNLVLETNNLWLVVISLAVISWLVLAILTQSTVYRSLERSGLKTKDVKAALGGRDLMSMEVVCRQALEK